MTERKRVGAERRIIDRVEEIRDTARLLAATYRLGGDNEMAEAIERAMARLASAATVITSAAAGIDERRN